MINRRIAIVVIAFVAVVAAGGIAVYGTFLAGDNVPELGLDAPSPSAPAASPVSAASPTAATPESGPSAATGDLAGPWAVVSGVAGYRVRETFLQQNAESDAVGRTEDVTGSLTVDGEAGTLRLASAQITVDMTTLRSDEDRRDAQLRGRGIQSDTFPTSTFDLATPVALPADLTSGDVTLELPGKLTLHGVARDVTITAQARLEADGTVVVVGSLPIRFADYAIEPPSIAGIIAVQDNGSLEFRVVFAKG
ncbi:MAG TPA: YceI family protein [Patescibacteria group bacterium]|nr:YceI family protein [Patescibacteria group bacterium]